MPLVNTKSMLEQAYSGGYAVGAFNVCNLETIQGVADAAFETSSPVIFQISPGALKYAGKEFLISLVKIAIEKTGITAALHLDHGNSFEICKSCIDSGFTSVMFDGSELPFEENVRITKSVVDYASDKNVSVEAELDKLCGAEEHLKSNKLGSLFTDPEQACEFIKLTGVDSLAIAIGTSHGVNKFYRGIEPTLQFDILRKIADLCPGIPFVLHGSSSINEELVAEISKYGSNLGNARGVPEDILKAVVKTEVCKINIDSDIRIAATLAIKNFLFDNPNVIDLRSYFSVIRRAIKDLVKEKITNILCSN